MTTNPTPTEFNEGDTVHYRGVAYVVGVDNGHAVHLPDLPDYLAINESWLPRAGKFGGPPTHNRWVAKTLLDPEATTPQIDDGGGETSFSGQWVTDADGHSWMIPTGALSDPDPKEGK